MRVLATVAGFFAVAVPAVPADATMREAAYSTRPQVCQTHACRARMCRSRACRHRVGVRRARRARLAAIRPYVSWLRSTGDCENGSYGGPGLRSGLRAYNPAGPFYNRYQFMWGTWASVGGRGDPRDAGWLEQAYRAVRLRQVSGRGAWPVCG